MLQEKRVTLTISSVNLREVEGEGGRKNMKTELWFVERDKSALLNKTQTGKIATVYGPETDNWKDKPVVLYGEFGKWFGKERWALRVDQEGTAAASRKPGGSKKATTRKSKSVIDDVTDDNDLLFGDSGSATWPAPSKTKTAIHRGNVKGGSTVADLAQVIYKTGFGETVADVLASVMDAHTDIPDPDFELTKEEALAIFDNMLEPTPA